MKSYPITFHCLKCVSCGNDKLDFYDIYNKKCREEIYPYMNLQCSKCGKKYNIGWEVDDKGEYKPYPVTTDQTKEFLESNIDLTN